MGSCHWFFLHDICVANAMLLHPEDLSRISAKDTAEPNTKSKSHKLDNIMRVAHLSDHGDACLDRRDFDCMRALRFQRGFEYWDHLILW